MAVPEFRTEKVTDRITRIFAHSGELMYLVEGEEKAALLDTGSGIGFFRPLVESLTDKPLIVLITHGHVDHAMGASEFPSGCVYINKEDAYIYEQHSTHAFRKAGLSMMGPAGEAVVPEEDFTPERPISDFNDLKEGDRFDLGGVSVEMFACPGHTKGSLVMLLPEERVVLDFVVKLLTLLSVSQTLVVSLLLNTYTLCGDTQTGTVHQSHHVLDQTQTCATAEFGLSVLIGELTGR